MVMRAKRTRNNKANSLAGKVLVLLLAIVLAFGLFATYRVVSVVKDIKREQAELNLQHAKTASGIIDDQINTAKQLIIPVAGQKDIRMQNYSAASKWMQWFVENHPDYCLAAFIDTNGKVKSLGVSDKFMEEESAWKIAVSNATQFAKTITASDVKVSGFKYSQIAKTSVVNLGYPVFDYNSKRIGVLVIAVDLTALQNKITKAYGGASNHVLVTVVDEKGFTIARSAGLSKFIGDLTPNSNHILKTMTKSEEGKVEGDFTEGVSSTVSFSSATKVPWFAYAGTKTDYIQSKVKTEILSLMIGFIPIMLLAVFGLWWVGRSSANDDKEMLAQPSSIDPTTGLWDSAKLVDDLNKEHERAKRYRQQLSFATVAINHYDHFINVSGHKLADDALCVLAQIVKNSVRATDSVYRYSSDEISILLPSTDKTGAEYLAKRIVKEVENSSFDGEEKQPYGKLTVSIGIATYPFDSISSEGLIECTDFALSKIQNNESSTFKSYENIGKTVYAVGEDQSRLEDGCG